MESELMNLVGNVGFPVVVTAYLLFRLEKQMTALSNSINKLNTIISAKLGVAIGTDSDGNDPNKAA